MNLNGQRKGRHFTEAARAAAAIGRRQRAENAVPVNTPAVFVTRLADGRFGWEIRRFGALVIHQNDVAYVTIAEARSAGERALPEVR